MEDKAVAVDVAASGWRFRRWRHALESMVFTRAKEILAALEREEVRYVLVGSMAMAAQGLVVRPQDRVDAEALRQRFGLGDE